MRGKLTLLFLVSCLVVTAFVVTQQDQPVQLIAQRLPEEIQVAWQAAKADMVAQIEAMDDAAVLKEYKAADKQKAVLVKRLGKDADKLHRRWHQREPAVIKSWLKKCIEEDLEPYLATSALRLSKEYRDVVYERIRTQSPPRLRWKWSATSTGATNRQKTLLELNPLYACGSYEALRAVVVHEFTHFYFQSATHRDLTGQFLEEGVTEQWVAYTSQRLGWSFTFNAYRDEVVTVTALISLMKNDLLGWYVADEDSKKYVYDEISEVLQRKGVARTEAESFIKESFTRVDLQLTGLNLSFESTQIIADASLLLLDMKTIDDEAEDVGVLMAVIRKLKSEVGGEMLPLSLTKRTAVENLFRRYVVTERDCRDINETLQYVLLGWQPGNILSQKPHVPSELQRKLMAAHKKDGKTPTKVLKIAMEALELRRADVLTRLGDIKTKMAVVMVKDKDLRRRARRVRTGLRRLFDNPYTTSEHLMRSLQAAGFFQTNNRGGCPRTS